MTTVSEFLGNNSVWKISRVPADRERYTTVTTVSVAAAKSTSFQRKPNNSLCRMPVESARTQRTESLWTNNTRPMSRNPNR